MDPNKIEQAYDTLRIALRPSSRKVIESLLSGRKTILEIARDTGMKFDNIRSVLSELAKVGLVRYIKERLYPEFNYGSYRLTGKYFEVVESCRLFNNL